MINFVLGFLMAALLIKRNQIIMAVNITYAMAKVKTQQKTQPLTDNTIETVIDTNGAQRSEPIEVPSMNDYLNI